MSETFQERLEAAMSKKHLNKAKLAKLLGTQPSTITRWFSGSIPQDIRAEELASVLGVSVKWLLHGEAQHNSDATSAQPALRLNDAYHEWDQERLTQIAALLKRLHGHLIFAGVVEDNLEKHYQDMCAFEIDEFFATLPELKTKRPSVFNSRASKSH